MSMTKEQFKIYVIRTINDSLKNDVPETVVLHKLKNNIQSIPSLNVREMSAMYKSVKKVADKMYATGGKLLNKDIYKLSVDINKITEHRNTRVRSKNLSQEMRDSRAANKVFYLCSTHSNPAEDHKEWQGKIYVDRYWKSTLADNQAVLKKVACYIKNKDILTVQEICGAPVYMVTRPYCMHYFIDLDTEEVLNNGLVAVRRNHPEAKSKEHHVDYRKKFLKTRKRIHTELGMDTDAAYDQLLINRAKYRERFEKYKVPKEN